MDAFMHGVSRRDLREEFGRLWPKNMIEVMKIANQWADGEDSVRNSSHYSPKDEAGPSNWREGRHKKKPRYNGNDSIELVAVGFQTPHDDEARDSSRQYSQGQYNRSGGSGYRSDGGHKREWQKRTLSPAEELEQSCRHHMFRNPETGKWGSNHLLKVYRKARKIYKAMQKIVTPGPAAQPAAQLADRKSVV